MNSTLIANISIPSPTTSSLTTFLQTNGTYNVSLPTTNFTSFTNFTNFTSVRSTLFPTTTISPDRCKEFDPEFKYDFHKNIPLASICALCFVIGLVVSVVGYRIFKITMGIKILSATSLITYLILLDRTSLGQLWCAVIASAAGTFMGALAAIVNTVGLIGSGIIQGLFLTVIILIVLDFFIVSSHIIWISIGLAAGLSLTCAIICIIWQKNVAIVYITSYGSILVMIAVDYYLDLFIITKYVYAKITQADSQMPCWFSWTICGLWPFIMIFGCSVQCLKTGKAYQHQKGATVKYSMTNKPKKKKKEKKHRSCRRSNGNNGDVMAQAWIQTTEDTLDKRRNYTPVYEYFPPNIMDLENTTLV